MFVFGGFGEFGDLQNSVYSFNTTDNFWQIEQSAFDKQPSPRAGHSSVMIKHKMFVFGGKGADNRKFNDLWIFDTQSA
jgi:N-acetylneuraminic acid mutarotase